MVGWSRGKNRFCSLFTAAIDVTIFLKGNLRQKRLLGYSIEESTSSEVKMVDCIVSILLSISNDQIENILAKLEEKMAEDFERKMDEFRDDVDIQMEGMAQIVSNTRDYVAHKGKGKTCFLM